MSVSRLYFSVWELLPPKWKHSGFILAGVFLAASYCSCNHMLVLAQLTKELGQLASPAQSIAVALLGLCLFPTARARFSSQQGGSRNSSSRPAGISSQDASAEDGANGSGASTSNGSGAAAGSACSSFKLARAPFADLSCGISTSFSCSSKGRRRRLPRLSVELTPLPRLSLEFQQRRRLSSSGSARCLSDVSGLGACSLFAPSSSSTGGSERWAPAMGRIQSGQDLAALAGDAPAKPGNAAEEATASLGMGSLPPGLEHLDEVISEIHLLQVGAMLGEASSRAGLVSAEAGGPVGHPQSFYGSAGTDGFLDPWEPLAADASSSVLYWAWRRPLRKGLFMYMTRSVFLEASPAELRAFMNDDAYRVVWDGSMSLLRRVAVPQQHGGATDGGNASVEAMAAAIAARTAGSGGAGSVFSAAAAMPFASITSSGDSSSRVLAHETGIMQALVQFPKPMASRAYLYNRRVWPRPADGGCYCLAKSCSLPDEPGLPCRAVAVDDYCSGCVIRSPAPGLLPPGYSGTAAEVFMVYFEDSHVRPGLANLGIKKGLWPLVQRTDKALRVYQAGAAANVHLQLQPQQHEQPDVLVQLQAASFTSSLGLSKQASLQLPSAQAVVQLERQASLPLRSCTSVPCGPLTGLEGDSTSDDEDEDGGDSNAAQQLAVAAPEPEAHAAAVPAAAASAALVVAAKREAVAEPVVAVPVAVPCSSPVKAALAKPAAAGASSTLTPTVAQAPKQQQPGPHEKQHLHHSGSSKASTSASHKKSASWWSRLTNAVASALRSSGQLLAAASIALWRSHTHLALMLPSLEWWLLQWLLRRLEAPCRLLLGLGGSCRRPVQLPAVSSHPIGDLAHPGVLPRLKALAAGPSLLRIPSHPLAVDDELHGDSPAAAGLAGLGCCQQRQHHCCCCAVAALHGCCGRRVAQSAFGVGAAAPAWALGPATSGCCSSAVHARASAAGAAGLSFEEAWTQCGGGCSNPVSCGVVDVAGARLQPSEVTPATTSSTCCSCSCGRTSAAGSTSSSMCCRGSSSGSGQHSSGRGSSRVRDCSGGRRHRRVVSRLVKAATVRLAHRLLSVLEQEHPGSPADPAAEFTAAPAEF